MNSSTVFLLYTVTFFRYGEGWDFGEVAKNGRGVNASQFNLGGTGIGRLGFFLGYGLLLALIKFCFTYIYKKRFVLCHHISYTNLS